MYTPDRSAPSTHPEGTNSRRRKLPTPSSLKVLSPALSSSRAKSFFTFLLQIDKIEEKFECVCATPLTLHCTYTRHYEEWMVQCSLKQFVNEKYFSLHPFFSNRHDRIKERQDVRARTHASKSPLSIHQRIQVYVHPRQSGVCRARVYVQNLVGQ